MPVHFHKERTSFIIQLPKKHSNWLSRIAEVHGRQIASLTYIFCSDAFLLELNKKYLRHNTLTDIITFDLSEGGEAIEAEIYISIPRVKENARVFGQEFDTELRRVLAHGLLHLLGFSDKRPSDKKKMRLEEDACLSLWHVFHVKR